MYILGEVNILSASAKALRKRALGSSDRTSSGPSMWLKMGEVGSRRDPGDREGTSSNRLTSPCERLHPIPTVLPSSPGPIGVFTSVAIDALILRAEIASRRLHLAFWIVSAVFRTLVLVCHHRW